MRALGVTTAKRSQAMPDVPTIAEAALPGFEVPLWYSILAPAGTPREAVARLSGDIAKVLAEPAMRERLASLGIQDWVERFDPAHYNRNATLAENLLFGTPVGKQFDGDNLAADPYMQSVLKAKELDRDLLRMGLSIAETMVELFSGLSPDNPLFEIGRAHV